MKQDVRIWIRTLVKKTQIVSLTVEEAVVVVPHVKTCLSINAYQRKITNSSEFLLRKTVLQTIARFYRKRITSVKRFHSLHSFHPNWLRQLRLTPILNTIITQDTL